MQRPSVVFPEPDSPTRPTLSFRPTSIDTSRRACTSFPPRPANTFRTPATRRIASSSVAACPGDTAATGRFAAACVDLISARISSSRTQALSRRGSTARSGGFPAVQASETQAQRDAKLHRSATSSGAGTEPSIATSRSSRRSAAGSDSSRPSAYGCSGSRSSAAAGLTSTSDPAYSTYTRCATENAIRRSWVMRMSPIPRACCTCFSKSRISACVVTSSAVDGSSAIRIRGSAARAAARPTRWRIPPESWKG